MKVEKLIEQKDGTALVTLSLTQKENDILIEYAVNKLLGEMIEKNENKKNIKQRVLKLEKIIHDTFWMARRYAHGRHTYAPGIIRDCYEMLKKLNIKIKFDKTIQQPDESKLYGIDFRNDYLDDCNE